MAIVTREFKICDRCQTEVQVYELDDEGNMSDNNWTLITVDRLNSYHYCPKCTEAFIKFSKGDK
jgi:DICT domain-containing protein